MPEYYLQELVSHSSPKTPTICYLNSLPSDLIGLLIACLWLNSGRWGTLEFPFCASAFPDLEKISASRRRTKRNLIFICFTKKPRKQDLTTNQYTKLCKKTGICTSCYCHLKCEHVTETVVRGPKYLMLLFYTANITFLMWKTEKNLTSSRQEVYVLNFLGIKSIFIH